jgi:hypothetical protein|tara:strand:- start:1250 stop:1687 length:438 start_codon:yes stop_codon:yes gene_type:complete
MFNIIDSSWENSISLYINSKFLKGIKSFTVKEKISFIKRKTYEYPLEKVVQVGVINEETQKEKKFVGSAVGAGLGAIVLGPIGLVAGALAGGNKSSKKIKIGIKFKDKNWIIFELDSKKMADKIWLKNLQGLKVGSKNSKKKAPF